MEHQIYRTVKVGERLEKGDVYPNEVQKQLTPIRDDFAGLDHDGSFLILRPVSIERVTGTESAFPAFDGSGAVGGMTLREHYAGLAMQGLLAGNDEDGFRSRFNPKDGAEIAVEWADALIAALNKKEEAA